MGQNKQDKIQMQKKIQQSYRKTKQMRAEDMDHFNDYSELNDIEENKIGSIIIRICVVLGVLVFLLNVFNKEF